jgi:flagellar biosynthesis/type III secretory pathway M-ring protein FliF/YscJ
MYHYLKWAALSYFFKRNLRYILLIAIALIGIYGSDAIYQDLKDYALSTDQKNLVLYFLVGKWVIVFALALLLVYGIMKLGLARDSKSEKKGRKRFKDVNKKRIDEQEDAISKRLEKFRGTKRLRRRSDILLERMKEKEGKG